MHRAGVQFAGVRRRGRITSMVCFLREEVTEGDIRGAEHAIGAIGPLALAGSRRALVRPPDSGF
jgi:hypothetical protein